MRARVWLPEVGVFSAIDELAYQSSRHTLWGWPGQSPYRYSDPSGRCPACVAALVTLIGFGVAAPSDTASAPADLPGMMAAVPGLGQAAGAGLRGIAGFLAPYVERTAPGLANALRGGARASAAAEAAGGSCGGGVAGKSAASRGVPLARATEQGLVSRGGSLGQVLGGIEREFAAGAPRSATDALGVVERATAQLGLEPGVATLGEGGDIVLQNVGGITTTLGPDGSILVERGSDVLLHLLP